MLLWAEMDRRGWSDAKLAEELGEDSGKIAKLLYGERKPGRQLSAKLLARLGTPIDAWDRPCTARRRVHSASASRVVVATEAKSA